jgi:hypothetical protein
LNASIAGTLPALTVSYSKRVGGSIPLIKAWLHGIAEAARLLIPNTAVPLFLLDFALLSSILFRVALKILNLASFSSGVAYLNCSKVFRKTQIQ